MMTKLREAAELALDALEELHKNVTGKGAPEHWDAYYAKQGDALDALRTALAQPEPWDTNDMAHRAGGLSMDQEPDYWVGYNPENGGQLLVETNKPSNEQIALYEFEPVYTVPPSKPEQDYIKRLEDDYRKQLDELSQRNYELRHPPATKPATPPSKPWQSLTDEATNEIAFRHYGSKSPTDIYFARAIEASLKELNYE